MNILMLLEGEFPPDDRVEKEAISLIREGYLVYLLCLTYQNSPTSLNYKEINVKRIKIPRWLRNKLMPLYLILPVYRWFWTFHTLKFIKKLKIDVIHVHDLPLSNIAFRLKKKLGVKVVCDQHELYTNWINRTAHYNTFIGKFVKYFSNWNSYEKKYLSKADLVITVEEPLKNIYIQQGISTNKIVVLPNTPNYDIFNPSIKDEEIIKKYSNHFVIFYAGTIDILRGINTIIEALPIVKKQIKEIKFVFAGSFTGKYYNPLKQIERLNLQDITEYLGFIPIEKLPNYIAASDICIHIPPASSDEVNNSIATKIYQYVLMNKPIIVGQAHLMKQFTESNNIGLSINDCDHKDLANKILMMYSNSNLMKEFTENTKRISMMYNWQSTSKSFLKSYKSL